MYKMTPSGKLTFIYTFPGTSGLAYPMAVTLGTDGNFYGTALGGGANGSAACSRSRRRANSLCSTASGHTRRANS